MVKERDTIPKLVLLDSHAILHRAYHALPDFATRDGQPTGALYGLAAMLMKIITELKPDYIAACYDLAGPTFRHEAYADYKGKRAKTDDALVAQMDRSRDIFTAFNIPIYQKEGFEADDMLGTIVEQVKKKKIETIVASGDMDTLQLVDGEKVKVYTLKKGINDTILYNEEGVVKRFGFKPELLPDYKGLRGDPSDNIIGIAGIGEKTATDLITNFGSIEEIYKKLKKDKKAFEKAGIKERIIKLLEEGKEEAEFSKTLATIRRDAPITYELPEKKWKEALEPEKILNLFQQLEFRALSQRAKDLFGMKTEGLNFGEVEEKVPEDELKETSLALWVLNSNILDPKLDDILNFGKTNSFKEARDIIFAELKKQNLLKVFEDIEKPLLPVVESMKERGIAVDNKYLKTLAKEYHARLDTLQKNIWKKAGEEFNINSPKQMSEVLFEKMKLGVGRVKKTATGQISTRESELEKMREVHPIIGEILSYRELQKLLSTYIDNIPDMVGEDGRLHARFVLAGSATGRMSSQDPNLQNIPVGSEDGRRIRNAFLAEKGFSLVAIDYSQVELRVAAFLSEDKKLIEIFKNNRDIHTEVAAEVFKVSSDKVTKDMRRQAKVINFGILYGMGVNALRGNLGEGTDRETAQKFYNNYFESFSGLASYLNKIKSETERKGYTETFFGRRRSFEGIKSKLPFIKAAAERMAINAPIQGTNADVVKIAMKRVSDYFEKEKLSKDCYLLLQVHDELIFEIRNEKIKEVVPNIKKIMESIINPKDIFGITLSVEAHAGPNWGELKDL